jgi:pimeloyl-ACP methyl ester carboxylesterase
MSDHTRREFLATLATFGALSVRGIADTTSSISQRNFKVLYGQDTRCEGIRSRIIDNNNGVKMHILESGFEDRNRPCVILLHGFPELAYTWRNQLLPLAQAGYHVIAPDLRGYGRSVTTPVTYDDDILQYSCRNLVSDVLGLVRALSYAKVAAVVGHDWGSPVAAWCALIRPDIFQSVALVSTPFGRPREAGAGIDIDRDLAALPRPRCSPDADDFAERRKRSAHTHMGHNVSYPTDGRPF